MPFSTNNCQEKSTSPPIHTQRHALSSPKLPSKTTITANAITSFITLPSPVPNYNNNDEALPSSADSDSDNEMSQSYCDTDNDTDSDSEYIPESDAATDSDSDCDYTPTPKTTTTQHKPRRKTPKQQHTKVSKSNKQRHRPQNHPSSRSNAVTTRPAPPFDVPANKRLIHKKIEVRGGVNTGHKLADEGEYECDRCGWHYTKNTQLNNHKRYCKRGYPCKIPGCGAILKSNDTYQEHICRHYEWKRYICPKCSQRFYRSQFQRHKKLCKVQPAKANSKKKNQSKRKHKKRQNKRKRKRK